MAKWLAGVTVGLAYKHPENVHMQSEPGCFLDLALACSNLKLAYVGRGVWENVVFEAACCCVRQRLRYAGSCDTTSRSTPDT